MREREDVIYYAKESDDFINSYINGMCEWMWEEKN